MPKVYKNMTNVIINIQKCKIISHLLPALVSFVKKIVKINEDLKIYKVGTPCHNPHSDPPPFSSEAFMVMHFI
jgi:hypothetical protein